MKNCEVLILGAGPAGLAAALELQKLGIESILIVEKLPIVGGLSRTEVFNGYRFDVGPHRFFTKNKEINALWHGILKEDFTQVKRLTRIFYKNRFFNYPLRPSNVLANMGLIDVTTALASYFAAQVNAFNNEAKNFEEWVSRRFGKKLFDIFFKTYTEKVWGISCSQISAEWAAQRIKGLDLIAALKSAFLPKANGTPKSLIEKFEYPLLGAGQVYERMAESIVRQGAEILLNTIVKAVKIKDGRVSSIEIEIDCQREEITAGHIISSIPVTQFINMCEAVPKDVQKSAGKLYFRDHINICFIVDCEDLFSDQWIYVHSKDLRLARLVNYCNFSKKMAARPGISLLSAEYFVSQGDKMDILSDDGLKRLAKEEILSMGLLEPEAILQSYVMRDTEAYPVYFIGFRLYYDKIKSFLEEIPNLTCIGRGGTYKYNNMEHSIMAGMLAARKLRGEKVNIWDGNLDAEYLEEM